MTAEELSKYITLARRGDAQAFAGIYDAYAKKLFRFIRAKVASQQQAEDILQDVFVKIWRGLPGYDPDKGSFNAWAYRVAGNALNDFFRKAYRNPEAAELTADTEFVSAPLQGFAASPERVLDAELDFERVAAAMGDIPELYRRVLEYRYLQGLETEEVAELLGKSALAVRLILHRALKKLKNAGKKRYGDAW